MMHCNPLRFIVVIQARVYMGNENKQRETVALVRNKLYRTYQFHGIVGRGKNPDMIFKTVISQIFLWLKDRFRQFEEVPEQIHLLSDISKINELSLQPFQINDGYIIETAYLAEDKFWAFRLTEPDTGAADRAPVPGRLFMTNFALRIVEDVVELGCKTLCSQPESISEDAEVFRPKLIRDIRDNLGLWDILDLVYESGNIADGNVLKKFDTVLKNAERNMPVVVVERKQPIPIDYNIPVSGDFLGDLMKPAFDKRVLISNETIRPQIDWTLSSNELAKSLCGFAYVFHNFAGNQNQIKIYYPSGVIEDIETSEVVNESQEYQLRRDLIDKIRVYPKRNEAFRYGNVVFLQEALAVKQERDLERLKHSENCQEELKELYRMKDRLAEEKTREEQKNRDCFEKLNEEKKGRKSDELSFRDKLRQISERVAALEHENCALSDQLAEANENLEIFRCRENRPDNMELLVKWIESEFGSEIILLPRAKDEIKKSRNCSIDLICDGIEVLAKTYRKWRMGQISEEEYGCQCKSLCRTPFEITLTGESSIRKYPKDYKVPYDDQIAMEHGGRRVLDQHLKYGVDPRFLLRIYFFWDDTLEKVVIGSMPEHLRSVQ